MKKFLKLAGVAALSTLALVACVENEESEGVKALRESQAGLIDAQAENLLATVQKTLEEVNGMRYETLTKKYSAVRDSVSIYASISDIKRQQELVAEQHAIAMLQVEADLEKAKDLIIKARLDLANSKNTTLYGYIAKYDDALSKIVALKNTIANAQYNVDIIDHVTDTFLIKSYERDITEYNINLKYANLSLDNAKAALSTYTSAVASPSNALANAQAAEVDMNKALNSVKEKTAEASTATKERILKSVEYSKTTAALGKIEQKINILSASGVASATIDGVLYKNISSYDADILSANNNINFYKNSLTVNEQSLATANADLASWTAKVAELSTSYNSTKSNKQTKAAALANAQTAYDAANLADLQYATSVTADAKTAAQNALTAAQLAYNAAAIDFSKAEVLYLNAQNEVASAQSSVNSINGSINSANSNIANYTNDIATYTAQKAAASSELTTLKGQLTAANSANDAAKAAFDAAVIAEADANAQSGYATSNYNSLQTLKTALFNLANGITGDSKNLELAVSSLEESVELLDRSIAISSENVRDLYRGIKQRNEIKKANQEYIAGLTVKLNNYNLELARYAELIKAYETTIK